MLVLTRRVGERLLIGNDITITVVACQGDKVRVGIDAPEDIVVLREELVQQSLAAPTTNTSAAAPPEVPGG